MRAQAARFALVRWPDAYDMTLPCCITIEVVDEAIRRGAILVGREWDVIDDGIDVSEPLHSNPRRQADGDESDQA
jgi:hypothetical protein